MSDNFIVECNVCGERFDNWSGSTPCCGSIAFVVGEDGKKTTTASMFASVNNGAVEPIEIDMKNKRIDQHLANIASLKNKYKDLENGK